MNDIIEIDGKPLDLDPGQIIAITWQVNDIADMQDRQSSFTSTIESLDTNKNSNDFENADQVYSGSNLPYKKQLVRWIKDGLTIIHSGICKTKINNGKISRTLYTGIIDFFSQIKDKKISELDLSAYNHVWTKTNIVATFNNTYNDGYIYALVDYMADSPNDFLDNTNPYIFAPYLYPSIFVRKLIELIFAQTNYKWTGKIKDDGILDNLIIPFNLDKLEVPELIISNNKVNVGNPTNIITINNDYDQLGNEYKMQFTDKTGSYYDLNNNFNYNEFIAPINANYNIDCYISTNLIMTLDYLTNQGFTVILDVAVNGIIDVALQQTAYHLAMSGNYTFNDTFNISTSKQLTKGDKISLSLMLFSTIQSIAWNESVILNYDNTSYFSCIIDKTIIYGGDIFINLLLPTFSQTDFLKYIFQMYGIIPVPDNQNKTINFVQFKEIYDNKRFALNWTTKMDMSKENLPQIDFDSGYAQKNYCLYQPNDFVTEGIGDGYFIVDDENLEEEKTVIQLPFSASEHVERFGVHNQVQLKIAQIKKMVKDEEAAQINYPNQGNPNYPEVIKNQTGIRILQLNKVTDPYGNGTLLVLYDLAGWVSNYYNIVYPLTYFAAATKEDGLSFSQFLLNKNYLEFTSGLLNHYKKVPPKFKLTLQDYIDYTEAKDELGRPTIIPTFLEQYGCYFFVNKIMEFNPDILSTLELIKM